MNGYYLKLYFYVFEKSQGAHYEPKDTYTLCLIVKEKSQGWGFEGNNNLDCQYCF